MNLLFLLNLLIVRNETLAGLRAINYTSPLIWHVWPREKPKLDLKITDNILNVKKPKRVNFVVSIIVVVWEIGYA